MEQGRFQMNSLNNDPHNVRAEELAMEKCMQDCHVQRRWSEQQMVVTFGGGEVAGTPDGMFEDADGSLFCVQVVRMPVLPEMIFQTMAAQIYEVVLTKLVKSMQWMKYTRIVPRDFVIFCWFLPLLRKRDLAAALQRPRALIKRVRGDGWPFSLRLAVAEQPDMLFPLKFAHEQPMRSRREVRFSEADLSSRPDFEIDDDDPFEWDLFAFEFEAGEDEVEPGGDSEELLLEEAIEEDVDAHEMDEDEEEDVAYRMEEILVAVVVAVACLRVFVEPPTRARCRESFVPLLQAWGTLEALGAFQASWLPSAPPSAPPAHSMSLGRGRDPECILQHASKHVHVIRGY